MLLKLDAAYEYEAMSVSTILLKSGSEDDVAHHHQMNAGI